MTPEQEIQQLKQRLSKMESIINQFVFPDTYRFPRVVTFPDGIGIAGGMTTGTSIGKSTTQKFSFYGVTPVVQASAIAAPSTPGGTYSQAEAQSAVDKINSIRTAIKNFGITA